ncbi:MAG: hypothetical protein WDN45_17710 [Caulobacteraceae bacterium]
MIGLLGCAPPSRAPDIAWRGAKLSQPTAVRLNGGTLVLVIPTADGALVAADSRTTSSNGPFRDDTQKIISATDLPVAAFATGATSADVPLDPSSGRMQSDYDVFAVLRREMGALKHAPDVWDFRRILTACGEDIARSHAAAQNQMKGRGLQIGMVVYDAASSTVSIYLGASGDGRAEPARGRSGAGGGEHARQSGAPALLRRYRLHPRRGAQGPGRAMLSRDTVRLLETTATVRQL